MADLTRQDASPRHPVPASREAARTGTRTRAGAASTAAAADSQPPTPRTPARKTAGAKTVSTKAPAKKAPSDKAPAKKAPPVKAPADKAPADKAMAKKAPAKKVAAKPATTKKATAPAPAAKRAPARRAKAAAPATTPRPAHPRGAKEYAGIRASLLQRLGELREEHDHAMADINDLQRDRVGDMAGDDQADTGTKTFEREQEISLANGILDRLTQAEHALDRLADGTYGSCERCGNPIPQARLEAFPTVTLCVTCKQHEERR